ncbi:hypothetical protein P153DRAFT_381358 [Dothidotthia symphoricarpi CBS 119687]|uniref:Uncharacterized protein n=1 Tax=Dothidotthia symphoricarpi CBS 119687 TaxID=1392245 RepID=A0A6A6ARK2_9PLEO|nr:uncharacterized protein P153DRAFT_381358 [Dothidotthia symphoricarpi CBS 119687]KAF2134176.1 hypothetical protein P153DRAFT_381358 [Dothidotthia symphoricarpi CBS 119687]
MPILTRQTTSQPQPIFFSLPTYALGTSYNPAMGAKYSTTTVGQQTSSLNTTSTQLTNNLEIAAPLKTPLAQHQKTSSDIKTPAPLPIQHSDTKTLLMALKAKSTARADPLSMTADQRRFEIPSRSTKPYIHHPNHEKLPQTPKTKHSIRATTSPNSAVLRNSNRRLLTPPPTPQKNRKMITTSKRIEQQRSADTQKIRNDKSVSKQNNKTVPPRTRRRLTQRRSALSASTPKRVATEVIDLTVEDRTMRERIGFTTAGNKVIDLTKDDALSYDDEEEGMSVRTTRTAENGSRARRAATRRPQTVLPSPIHFDDLPEYSAFFSDDAGSVGGTGAADCTTNTSDNFEADKRTPDGEIGIACSSTTTHDSRLSTHDIPHYELPSPFRNSDPDHGAAPFDLLHPTPNHSFTNSTPSTNETFRSPTPTINLNRSHSPLCTPTRPSIEAHLAIHPSSPPILHATATYLHHFSARQSRLQSRIATLRSMAPTLDTPMERKFKTVINLAVTLANDYMIAEMAFRDVLEMGGEGDLGECLAGLRQKVGSLDGECEGRMRKVMME